MIGIIRELRAEVVPGGGKWGMEVRGHCLEQAARIVSWGLLRWVRRVFWVVSNECQRESVCTFFPTCCAG